jgi:DNA-binding winged helix-turn-helix (wHTH) protein/TolB-like protein/Flp pilus assembly protein TadD
MSNALQRFYEFGPFRLDPVRHRLTRDGELIPLTPKALELLLALIQHSGKVVEKDELMQRVWPDTFVEESNLSVHVFALRKALGETLEGQSYIETVPRQGYRFMASVRDASINGAELVVERHTLSRVTIEEQDVHTDVDSRKAGPTLPSGSTSPTWLVPASVTERGAPARAYQWLRKRTVFIPLTLFFVLTAGVAYRQLSNEAKPPQTSAEVKSLAVLPFRTLGGATDEGYFGLGLADALITQFGQTQRLVVRPTSAVGKYAEREYDPLEVGRALGVEAVLEGHTQRAGERLRVTARLVRVSDGVSLWAGTFDEKMTDIFAVQDSISRQVNQALISDFGETEARSPAKRPTENVEAYQLYLKGRYLWSKKDGITKAVKYFEQAILIDPKYAQAYSGLADCYLALSEFSVIPREEGYSKATSAAEQAVLLDPGLSEAHTTLGFIRLTRDWDYISAEREFKRAIELDPNDATAYQFYGVYLLAVGQTDAAIAQTRRALQLDPLSILNNSQLARCLYLARRYDETIEQSRKTLELDSTSSSSLVYLGQSYAHKGMFAEATAELQKSLEMSNGRAEMKSALGYVYAVSGRTNEAQQLINELAGLNRESSFVSYHIAAIHAGLGEKEQALTWLEQAYQERDIFMGVRLKTDPKLDSLRSDPRFQNLLRRVGLTS